MRLFIFILLSFTLTSCFNRWSDEERKAFETQCLQTDTFKILPISFIGFENDKFNSILVKEFKNATILDSFKISISPSNGDDRTGYIERTMNVHHNYQFIIPGQRPYLLTGMEMVMWATWTESSEGHCCLMGNYSLDGIKYLHQGNLRIKKREMEPHTISRLQGKWVHELDSLSIIEISEKMWTEKYNGTEDDDIYSFEITDKLPQYVDTIVKTRFVILTNSTDTVYYEMLGFTDSLLSLMHFPSGQRHLYVKRE